MLAARRRYATFSEVEMKTVVEAWRGECEKRSAVSGVRWGNHNKAIISTNDGTACQPVSAMDFSKCHNNNNMNNNNNNKYNNNKNYNNNNYTNNNFNNKNNNNNKKNNYINEDYNNKKNNNYTNKKLQQL